MESVVSELEGTLLKNHDPFSYLMLVAFEASGIIRFATLLMCWPLIKLLYACGMDHAGLNLTVFVATVGVRISEIESVARAVLPKFYMDDLDMEAWRVFASCKKKVVVTKTPRIMVERFVKENLVANEVLGTELVVNRFGFATGFIKGDIGSISHRVSDIFRDHKPSLGLGRSQTASSFLSICKEQCCPPYIHDKKHDHKLNNPIPVIFHDGRLVKRPTPSMALLVILWIPLGILLTIIRLVVNATFPMWVVSYLAPVVGIRTIVKGKPPQTTSDSKSGMLFVCNHQTPADPVILSIVLGRGIPVVTYSLSRITEIISPIPIIRLTRIRDRDAKNIKSALAKGDLIVCPEGTTCREPFLLRFSALFAEMTDEIVPVAISYSLELFHVTTARGWKGLDIIFLFMNPWPVYEVTFLNQLPREATCSSGKSPLDVANYVQGVLAATLGFECTNFTRKDKYRMLAGNDGIVS